jgi:hypothetical protein
MKITVLQTIELDTSKRITLDNTDLKTLQLLVSTNSAEYPVQIDLVQLHEILKHGYFEFKEYKKELE